ncbi:MAG: thiamine phosphate synthase [Planctomycetota bacterium]|nr:thiamine phosphate synthase [Planctomycetota bacterium]
MPEPRTAPPRLVVISRGDLTEARSAEAFAREVAGLSGAGLGGLVLREPNLPDGPLLELASRLRGELGWLAVHDRIHVARAAGADAAHLGFRSLRPADARLAAGDLALGLSTHAGDDPATWSGVDYLFHGPVFETPSKSGLLEPTGVDGFRAALERRPRSELPMLALGGITPANAPDLLAAGAHGIAVIGAVLGAASPREALLDLLGAIA